VAIRDNDVDASHQRHLGESAFPALSKLPAEREATGGARLIRTRIDAANAKFSLPSHRH